jgi:hypothetical protein
MRGPTIALVFLLLGGAAAGCSGDDGTDAQPYVDALSEELQSDQDFPIEEDQADCIAEASIDALGAGFLEDNDISPEDVADVDGPDELDVELSEDQARGTAAAFVDCDVSFGEAFAGAGASDEAIECVDDNLDDDVLVDAFTAQYLGDEDEANQIFEEMFTTVSEECEDLFTG